MDTPRNWLDLLNPKRRNFLKTVGAGAAVATTSGLVELGSGEQQAQAFAYEPYPRDDQLTTVVTSCDHNCGSRHMLVAHKKGDVIVRLSTDDGRYQEGGKFGFENEQVPQLRACLRGRSYRSRLYSPERLLYPMLRVGERGEGKFKRVSWDEALNFVAQKMVDIKQKYGPTAILDQAYAGT
ncbi:MAG: molybdopterin-dependent oxidoreductase, partial [Dechloromonas agitata]|nr:molybdopterin-dependent oxidoreductase [Dechloromonas agitata]